MIDSSMPLYLASKSPRRRKLLKLLYPHIHVLDVHTDESFYHGETPALTVKRIAQEKMDEAVKMVKQGLIITADTIVVCDDKILGKPTDEEDAVRILQFLSNRAHFVFTGICIQLNPQKQRITSFERTKVFFREIGDDEIRAYVHSGSPMDKAGAYGIQDDYGAVFVKKITGCYYNVVGLPISKVHSLITKVLAGAPKA